MLACISTIISSTEYLSLIQEFSPDGAFSWTIFSSRPTCVAHPRFFRATEFLFERRATQVIHVLRITACVVLLFLQANPLFAHFLIPLLALSGLVLSFRDIVGTDGSDQMTSLIFCALTFYTLCNDEFVRVCALLFIACQSVLSYVIAGIAKLLSRKWRGGVAMAQIMNTRAYGMEFVGRTHARLPAYLNQVICWVTIAAESLFFLVLLLPSPYFLFFICWGIVFHIFNAVAMGLNTFFWSFLATYPCIFYVHHLLMR